MAKRKETDNDGGHLSRRLYFLRGKVLLSLAVVGLLGWGMHEIWQRVAPEVIHRERYLLQADHIEITPLPEWIGGDVRKEVIQHSGLDHRLSILDSAFMQVIEDAFVLHPWVATVDQIKKSYPPGVQVELTYRKPIAVVEMASNRGVNYIPIDEEAIHLPSNDVPNLLKRYLPRIGGIVERPPVGQKWADERVTGSADLATRLADNWEKLHLVDILPSSRPEIRGEHRYFVFDLITRGGTRIVWGAAPQFELPNEDSFEEKLDRLRECIQNYGTLDSVQGPAVVDVRQSLSITPRTVKKPTEVKQAAKKMLKQAAKEAKSDSMVK